MLDDKEYPIPPAAALVSISRVQGSMNLFGTPIRPLHFMIINVHEVSSDTHGLGARRLMPGKLVLELAMSEMQFAEMITTPNSGTGTPCTLRYSRDGTLVKLDAPPPQSSAAARTREEFSRKVAERMASVKAVRRRLEHLVDIGNLSKAKKNEIKEEVGRLMRLFTSTAPFMMERFEENAEAVVAEVKAEITAHADLVAKQTGIASLTDAHVLMLPEGSTE